MRAAFCNLSLFPRVSFRPAKRASTMGSSRVCLVLNRASVGQSIETSRDLGCEISKNQVGAGALYCG
jgi:hypothetical protein